MRKFPWPDGTKTIPDYIIFSVQLQDGQNDTVCQGSGELAPTAGDAPELQEKTGGTGPPVFRS